MKAWIIQVWLRLQSSYYFIPGLMCFGAVGLAFLMTTIDLQFQAGIQDTLGWFYAATVEGARSVLTTIAGSMISVAAVTFSLTMVAVTTAAGQYGPRLIGNFMRDRANQITLGMFLSTFVYCLLVLRSVSAQIGQDAANTGLTPSLSVLVALILTFVSVAVLIFFVHHIPETLNVGNLTGKVATQIQTQIEEGIFPTTEKHQTRHSSNFGDPFISKDTQTLTCSRAGFVEAVSLKGLAQWAEAHNLRVKLRAVPGDFVMLGTPILDFIMDQSSDELSASDRKDLYGFIAIGRERTAHQNLLFLADELVEIAARALSPGVNDPFTAMNCIQWFGNAVMVYMHSPEVGDTVCSEQGSPRIWAKTVSLNDLCETLFGKSRPYICEDENAAELLLTVLYTLREQASSTQTGALTHQLDLAKSAISQSSLGQAQKERLRQISLA